MIFLALWAGNNYAQPTNDGCANATNLTPSNTNVCNYYSATTSGASQSMSANSCNGNTGNPDDDVWFWFDATANAEVITVIGSSGFDAVVELWANCFTSGPISCADVTANGGTETITINTTQIGTFYNIRVFHYGTGSGTGTFQICVSQFAPSSCTLGSVTPTLISPGTGSSPGQTLNTTTPALSWNTVNGASNYEVYISKYPYGSANIVYQNTCVSGTSLTIPPGNLIDGTQYRWNIVAVSGCGSSCASNVASPLYFDVQLGGGCTISATTPTISSPGYSSGPGQDIGTSTTPTLSWNAVSGATDYGVYIRDMYTNTLIVNDDCASSGTSYTVPSGILYNGGQFRWNVQANVSCGSCASNFASPLYFHISTTVGGLNGFTEKNFNIYPNPSSGAFTIETGSANIPAQIKVFNAIGETVYSETIKNLSKKEINLNHVSAGVYSVHVITGEKNYHEKIVIE